MKNKIIFLTGTRADFGKMKSIILLLKKNKLFSIEIFVTGMHLIKRYGYTINEIKKLGINNIYTFNNQKTNDQMDVCLSKTIKGFSSLVKKRKPNLIIVHGDRLEALAGAIVGLFNNILVARIEGGEVSGTVDESIRHSISKLSHLHFVSNLSSKKRLIQLGEKKSKIFVIGSPEIDIMNSKNLPSINEVKKIYKIGFIKYSILIFHPVTTEYNQLSKQIRILIKALKLSGRQYVAISPNNDKGSKFIFNEYRKLKKNKNFLIFPSMRFEFFLTLLKNCEFIIGNSSAGVREAPYYGIPTINLGSRQNARFNSYSIKNIVFDEELIIKSINSLDKTNKIKKQKYFGAGNSALRFRRIILKKNFWKTKIQKKFMDRSYFGVTN